MTISGGAASGLALLAAMVWGTSDFLGGMVTRRATPGIILLIAHGMGLLALLAIMLAHPVGRLPTRHTVEFGLIAGLAGGIGLLALYKALSLGSMGLVAALSGVLTAVVPVLVSFFSEGRPSLLKMAGFAVAVAAIWLIAYTPATDVHPHGLWLAVLAGICFGILLVFLHLAGKDNVLWALTFSRVASASCALILILITAKKLRPRQAADGTGIRWRAVFPLATAAGLLDTLGNVLYTASSLAGRLDVAAVLSSLYPAGTILLAIWLLRERATRSQTAGMALAMVAVAMISA